MQNRTAPTKFKQVYTCPPEKCRTERHLPADTTLKVWLTMYATGIFHERARGDGQFLFTAPVRPWLANAVGCDPDTVDAGIARLRKLDWIVLVAKGRRRKDGTLGPNTYRLRTHDEYVKLHSGNCPPYPCKPNDEAKPIRLPAKKMSRAELDQFLQHAPQLEPVRRIWAEIQAAQSVILAMPENERMAWLESLKDLEASPVPPGEVTSPVPAATTPVQTGLDHSGSNSFTTPVPTPEPVRLEPEESLFILNKHTTHPILPAAPSVCDVLISNPSTKGKREEPLRRQDPSLGATATPSPLVETVSAARAAELVGALLKRGDDHGNVLKIVGNNRKELAALAMKHGETLFRKACDAFLKESPWNERTIAPYKMLVDGFESYIGQVERIEQAEVDDAKQEIVKEASMKASMNAERERLVKQFGTGKPDGPKVSPLDLLS